MDSLEATTRFELVIRVLQTHALPLGYVASMTPLGIELELYNNILFYPLQELFYKKQNNFSALSSEAEEYLLDIRVIHVFPVHNSDRGIQGLFISSRVRDKLRGTFYTEISHRKRILNNKCAHLARFQHSHRNSICIKPYRPHFIFRS